MGVSVALAALSWLWSVGAKGDAVASLKVGEGGRLFEAVDAEALLERPYTDHVPMASTGECLWAAHPDGWAFANGVHYYLLTPHGVGYDLQLSVNGAPIVVNQATSRPSHIAMTGASSDVQVTGAKWITADDVMAVMLTMRNDGVASSRVDSRLILPSVTVAEAQDTLAWQTRLHHLDVRFVALAPGFTREPEGPEAATRMAFCAEGESPVAQEGSQGADHKAAAAGGQVLGSNFGAEVGHFAVWDIPVGQALEGAVLSMRYARSTPGEARFRIAVGEAMTFDHAFESTGGWGDRAEDFDVVDLPLGTVPAGVTRVRLEALAEGSNLNIDRLCLRTPDAPFPAGAPLTSCYERRVELAPGASETVCIYVAVSSHPQRPEKALARLQAASNPLQDQVETYNAWLTANVPAFKSNDALTRQYWHRATSIVKKNLFRVGEGRLSRWAIAEGRWKSSWYPNVISYGAGHQIRETRWLRDPQYVRDIIVTWCESQKANGVFPSHITPDMIGEGQYTDWITSTVWDAYCVEPAAIPVAELLPALQRNVDGWLATYDTDADGLLLVDSHWWTGMEWQPSFFAFNGFDKDKQDQHLERVDLTAYVYGNALGLSRLFEVTGDEAGAAHYRTVADRIREALIRVMWDDGTRFFYSVEPTSHAKAMVKEVIGVYPFYFSMFGPDATFVSAWTSILNPDEFWTRWPVASATKQCPAYSQDVTFNGKNVGGCMWNGPTWPHANSLVLSAMAATLREYAKSPLEARHFQELLDKYTMSQFLNQDLRYPWTGEYLNGDTAAWRTDERDYDHSTYIDLIVADLAGLRPRADAMLELHPTIAATTPDFLVDGIRYHGHDVTIAWHRDADASPDGLTGYRVYVDGRLVHRSEETPGRVILEL